MEIPILKKDDVLLKSDLEKGFLVLIDKPSGWTSFDVCKKIRSIVNIKKVGHGGTLDPFATGLMIIGVGKGTKAMSGFLESTKKYNALVQFGVSTNTYDITGDIQDQIEEFELSFDAIDQALKKFVGVLEQVPPMFSAKKVNGQPLYKYARKGVELERKPVKIEIYQAEIDEWQKPFLKLKMHVSKGTYIRSYAHDLGAELGIPAVLNELQRTQIDAHSLSESFTIDEFYTYWKKIAA